MESFCVYKAISHSCSQLSLLSTSCYRRGKWKLSGSCELSKTTQLVRIGAGTPTLHHLENSYDEEKQISWPRPAELNIFNDNKLNRHQMSITKQGLYQRKETWDESEIWNIAHQVWIPALLLVTPSHTASTSVIFICLIPVSCRCWPHEDRGPSFLLTTKFSAFSSCLAHSKWSQISFK